MANLVAEQLRGGSRHVMGVMIESHLVASSQRICAVRSQLTYGQSVTDACIDLDTTRELLAELAAAVAQVGERRLVAARAGRAPRAAQSPIYGKLKGIDQRVAEPMVPQAARSPHHSCWRYSCWRYSCCRAAVLR